MPRFQPSHGFTTEAARRDWMDAKYLSEGDCSKSLVADPDPSAPLFHWQLFSLLGSARITQIVRAFYEPARRAGGSGRPPLATISPEICGMRY